jgi:hypothetical protein
MGNRVFEKLANPDLLKRSPVFVFAADALVAYGITGIGMEQTPRPHYRTRPEYLQLQREITADGHVDGLLMSPADAETLAIDEGIFDNSPITPMVRLNAETWIWSPRHGNYNTQTSQPFRTVLTSEAGRYCTEAMTCARDCKIKLGLYSITLNNDTEADARTLGEFLEFAWECGNTPDFDYFLEVFLPNVNQPGMDKKKMGEYVADSIVRTLSYLRKHQRPLFVKTVFTDATIWKALTDFDPTMIFGALGGSYVNAKHSLKLAFDSTENGGRVILFGRAVFQEKNPRLMAQSLRAVLDRQKTPDDAHAMYQRSIR